MGRLVDLTDEDWDHNMAVNARGVFLCSRAVARRMLERGRGTIINIASMAGLRGVPLLSHYAASKWAVIGFTKSIAQELAPYVTVNAVCPGYVATDMQAREIVWEAQLRKLAADEVRADYVAHTPLGRIETPEDVAQAVLFLASDAAAFLTGVALPVTGGADLV
jgi:NAD(P)-dependent dehydrogenase (short-subunit alcohol dehydrogenase family)